MIELLLGLMVVCVAVVGVLQIWYLRNLAKEAYHLGFIIWDIAREQGWLEVEEEENENSASNPSEKEDCQCEDCKSEKQLKELAEKHEAFAKLYIL